MNILVDENIPWRTVDAFRALGHSVFDVRGKEGEGDPDEQLWQRAQLAHPLLISTDKGFRHKHGQPHWGILIVRLRQPNASRIHARVMKAITSFSETDWPGLLVILRDRAQSVLRGKRPQG